MVDLVDSGGVVGLRDCGIAGIEGRGGDGVIDVKTRG